MTVLLLLFVIFALASVLALREPEIRRRLAAGLRRREGTARAAFGISQPRDLQRQALSLIKEGSLVSIGAVHLPSEVTMILNPSDLEDLGELRAVLTTELTEAIIALDRQHTGQGLQFALHAKPNVILDQDAALPRGAVDVRLGFLEGTVAVTVNLPQPTHPYRTGPARQIHTEPRLRVEIAGTTPFSASLCDGLRVGRSADCGLCISHESISRRHAEFTVSADGETAIIDLNSTNGIRLGDSPEPIPVGEPVSIPTQTKVGLSKEVSLILLAD